MTPAQIEWEGPSPEYGNPCKFRCHPCVLGHPPPGPHRADRYAHKTQKPRTKRKRKTERRGSPSFLAGVGKTLMFDDWYSSRFALVLPVRLVRDTAYPGGIVSPMQCTLLCGHVMYCRYPTWTRPGGPLTCQNSYVQSTLAIHHITSQTVCDGRLLRWIGGCIGLSLQP